MLPTIQGINNFIECVSECNHLTVEEIKSLDKKIESNESRIASLERKVADLEEDKQVSVDRDGRVRVGQIAFLLEKRLANYIYSNTSNDSDDPIKHLRLLIDENSRGVLDTSQKYRFDKMTGYVQECGYPSIHEMRTDINKLKKVRLDAAHDPDGRNATMDVKTLKEEIDKLTDTVSRTRAYKLLSVMIDNPNLKGPNDTPIAE
jgi:uncharacterized protein YjgD (DUF1641 family)